MSTGQNTWNRPDPLMDDRFMALVILRIAIVERVDMIKIFTKQFFISMRALFLSITSQTHTCSTEFYIVKLQYFIL